MGGEGPLKTVTKDFGEELLERAFPKTTQTNGHKSERGMKDFEGLRKGGRGLTRRNIRRETVGRGDRTSKLLTTWDLDGFNNVNLALCRRTFGCCTAEEVVITV